MVQLKWFLKIRFRPPFVIFIFFSVIYIIYNIYNSSFSKFSRPKGVWERELQELQDDEEFSFVSEKFEPFLGEIFVHIDLKGAPPKLSFLLEFISYVKKLGVTGILLEYEDMFPYHDGLEDIAAENAYTLPQIAQIVAQADKNNMTIIPFLPTFGHFEFVLKLEQYRHFREVDEHPDALCPSQRDVYPLLEKMIDQILTAHPKTKYFHIGSDEPGFLGVCQKCRNVMRKNKWRADDIYFNHVRRMAQHITSVYPRVRPIIWGHKIIKENEKMILTHKIHDLVDVMVYSPTSERKSFPKNSDMKSLARLFRNIWGAGAFKGTTGRTRITTNPEIHLRNTKSWMRFIIKWKRQVNFKGFAFLGWQRYNHFSSLCELLPVAIPTLALNLQFMKSPSDFDYVSVKAPDCDDYDVSPSDVSMLGRCGFPGFDIFQLMSSYSEKVTVLENLHELLKSGTFSFYNLFNNITSSQFLQSLNEKKYGDHLYELNFLEKEIRISLGEIYDEHTLEEWVTLHIMPQQMLLEAAVNTISVMNNKKVWPKRPSKNNAALAWKYFSEFCNFNHTIGCAFFIR